MKKNTLKVGDMRRKESYFSLLATRYSILVLLSLASCLAQAQTVGLIQNDSLAFNGYTLFAPASSTTTYLIDNCGNTVNTWKSNYRPGEVAYLLENGNLLRTCRLTSNVFFGGGIGGRIEMYNWEGELLWSYNYNSKEYHQHHDLEYLPNGNILLIAWESHTEEEAIAAGREPTAVNEALWSTQIIEIQPIGTEEADIVWEWHLWDHLVQDTDTSKLNYGIIAHHPELLNINFIQSGGGGGSSGFTDWVHANSVDYNPELDQIIVNSRHLSEFWVIDHSTTTEEAAGHTGGNAGKGGDILYRWGNPQAYQRGSSADQKTFRQHDVHWIPKGLPDAGKVMIFNNGQGRTTGNYSSIDVIELPMDADGNYTLPTNEAYEPTNLYWTYEATPPESFYSSYISGAQRMPNGNTLICEGAQGRFFEVDMMGNTLWEYLSPVIFGGLVSQGDTPNGQNAVFRAYRYAPDYEAFTGRNLMPGDPIELNPIASDCQIYETIVSTNDILTNDGINIFPNPVTSHLNVENTPTLNTRINMYDLTGKIILQEKQYDNSNFEIDMTGIPTGIYFIHFYDEKNVFIGVEKILKM